MTALELRSGVRRYGELTALDHVDLKVERGELVAIVGPSGSGKSTLLNALGTLDRLDEGTLEIAGRRVDTLDDDALSLLRAQHIGFIFQHFHLTSGASALDNVADGLLYTGAPAAERRAKAREALGRVHLEHRTRHRPHQMSGGEKQRVAIARAIVADPVLVLADEPTGALDSVTGASVIDLLEDLNAAGTTVLVITHDLDLARRFPRRVKVRDGRVESDERTEALSGAHR